MIAVFVSLALLGLAAIDPIGIAIMPILLLQRRPYARSGAFLGGSFVSLMIMGLVFARGCGRAVLHFEKTQAWLVPTAEIAAGVILLGVAATVFWQLKTGRFSLEPSGRLRRRLRLGGLQLFVIGALLVAVQSVVDVVFVLAMIRIGQLNLSALALTAAVATYAVAALVLQIAVVAAYGLAAPRRRRQVLDSVHRLLARYAVHAVITVSLGLGVGLLAGGVLGFA